MRAAKAIAAKLSHDASEVVVAHILCGARCGARDWACVARESPRGTTGVG